MWNSILFIATQQGWDSVLFICRMQVLERVIFYVQSAGVRGCSIYSQGACMRHGSFYTNDVGQGFYLQPDCMCRIVSFLWTGMGKFLFIVRYS